MINSHSFKLISSHPHCEVKQNQVNDENALFATSFFTKGDIIVHFGASKIVNTPNYLTVQVSEDKHIHLNPSYLQYINHSCAPNVLFNTSTMELECLKNISKGEELTFFYPATEWKMSQQFSCHCGKPNCVGLIQGASEISNEVLKKYKLTDFIQSMAKKYNTLCIF